MRGVDDWTLPVCPRATVPEGEAMRIAIMIRRKAQTNLWEGVIWYSLRTFCLCMVLEKRRVDKARIGHGHVCNAPNVCRWHVCGRIAEHTAGQVQAARWAGLPVTVWGVQW